MRAPYPTPEDYRQIYAQYYNGRSVSELCKHLGTVKKMHCLDLCSGDGVATEYFIQQKAEVVWSVDEAVHMTDATQERSTSARVVCDTVENALRIAQSEKQTFNRVVCRQGINYWFDQTTIALLADRMESSGIFVFNTFNQKPSNEPRVRTYTYDDLVYGEIAYSVGNIIHTVVASEGFEPHQSEILWLSREYLHRALSKYFHINEVVDGSSSIYICRKK